MLAGDAAHRSRNCPLSLCRNSFAAINAVVLSRIVGAKLGCCARADAGDGVFPLKFFAPLRIVHLIHCR